MGKEIRIFGPPGCGKTTYLCRQVKHAVEKHGPDSLILASFTKTAAAELGGRDLPISHDRIGTLHAHCYRSLGSPKVAESNIKEFNEEYKDFAITPQGDVNIDESAADMAYDKENDRVFAQYQVNRAQMIDRRIWATDVLAFAKAWESWKGEAGYIDFTDMIERVRDLGLPAPYGATIGIFDEVQDFTPLQLSLIRSWGKNLDFFLLAGDDDQTLYTFTGATPDAFLKPDIPKEQKIILSQSYRVPRIPQRFAQTLIKRVQNREPKEYNPRDEDGELLSLRSATWKMPKNLVEDIERVLEQKKSVMILAACGYMLAPTISMLRSAGIPFANPYRVSRGDWNPLKMSKGSTCQRTLEYLNPKGPEFSGVPLWTPRQLASWVDMLSTSAILNRGWKKKIIDFAMQGDDYNMTEYGRLLVSAFQPQALDEATKRGMQFILKNIDTKRRNSIDYIASVLRRGEKHIVERPRVCVGTIHSVKGGQADVVYLFPDLSLNGYGEYSSEGVDSVIRQFYVGITRCKESLIICRPAGSWFVRELII